MSHSSIQSSDPHDFASLARGVELESHEPLLVALSGGADSVFLLHAVARERPTRSVFALHVDHGLRGSESRADAAFCADLCRTLHVPFESVSIALDGAAGDLEARARRERYRALCRAAARLRVRTIATGHHADDALETLLLRWTRGSSLCGSAGPAPRLALAPRSALNPTEGSIHVVRPLLALRRSDIQRALAERGLAWREDSSNRDMRFTRNRIRHGLLPAIAEHCGVDAVEHLLAFGRAVATLEDALAQRIEHLAWSPIDRSTTEWSPRDRASAGVRRVARATSAELPRPLQRRALVRLLAGATGRTVGAALLAQLQGDIASARCTRRALPNGWTLVLGSDELRLVPPAAHREPFHSAEQLLALPGEVRLADGRKIAAVVHEPPCDAPVPRGACEVDLDARDLPAEITVRFARPGDRFHPLGAPGSKRLCRFLADSGIPREERARVPLVFAGDELVWVAGVRPCDRRRVHSSTRKRLRLVLAGHDARE